jgi:hypothetical protein
MAPGSGRTAERGGGGWAWLKVLEPPCATRHGRARKKGRAGGGGGGGGEAKAAEMGSRNKGRVDDGQGEPSGLVPRMASKAAEEALAPRPMMAAWPVCLPLGPGAVLPSGRREDGASLVRLSVPFPTSAPPVPWAERRNVPSVARSRPTSCCVKSGLRTASVKLAAYPKGGACSTAGNGMRSPLPQSKEIP